MRLEGKVAIVTGGGTGIGRAIVERLAADGAHVCITGPWSEALEAAAMALPQERVKTCVADVTDPADVERIVQIRPFVWARSPRSCEQRRDIGAPGRGGRS